MPLRADRVGLEWILRIVAVLAMVWLLAGAFRERKRSGGEVVAPGASMIALERWAARPPADTLGLELTSAPDPQMRDYLRALRANGTSIAWSNGGISTVMIEAEALQDPAGGTVVRVTGERGSVITLSDSLGVLDSVRIDAVGATIRVPAFSGSVDARAGSTLASGLPLPGPTDRSVVVLGLAGWESKFTIRALEERGWRVESRIALAPRLETTRGTPFPLDTARHVAVIALDSSAVTYTRDIQQFVRSGGGLILGDAALPWLRRIAPAGVGGLVRPAALRPNGADPRRLLGFRSLTPLRDGALGLELRDGSTAIAAWRVGSGRVLQSGYRDTWRWRMEGGDNAVTDHRAWWAGLVATVAYRASAGDEQTANPAPLASLMQALGPPGTLPSGRQSKPLWPLAVAILLTALFAEWFSRRLRGAA
jgi:hypothetical protein